MQKSGLEIFCSVPKLDWPGTFLRCFSLKLVYSIRHSRYRFTYWNSQGKINVCHLFCFRFLLYSQIVNFSINCNAFSQQVLVHVCWKTVALLVMWVVEITELLHVQIVQKEMVLAGVMEIADGLMQVLSQQQLQRLAQQLLPPLLPQQHLQLLSPPQHRVSSLNLYLIAKFDTLCTHPLNMNYGSTGYGVFKRGIQN